MNLEEIQKEVKSKLSDKRYNHCVCVMNMCEELAKVYNVNIEEAKKVGMAHDVAKQMTQTERKEYIKANNIYVDKIEKEVPSLLHAKIGADIATKKFGFTKSMSKAIESHTTGKENMDMLAKILYVADWTGEDRDLPNLDYIRKLSKQNIDQALIYTLENTIKEKIGNGELVHLDSILARNYLINKTKNK